MGIINDYDETPGSNNATPPDGAPENTMAYSQVNDTFREMMGRLKQEHVDRNGARTSSGTGIAITLNTSTGHVAYYDGMRVRFRAALTNTASTTINVNAIGVRPIVNRQGDFLVGGEIVAGQFVELIYDSSNTRFVLQSGPPLTIIPRNTTSTGAVLLTDTFFDKYTQISGTDIQMPENNAFPVGAGGFFYTINSTCRFTPLGAADLHYLTLTGGASIGSTSYLALEPGRLYPFRIRGPNIYDILSRDLAPMFI